MILVGGRVISVPTYDPELFFTDLRDTGATWFEGMGTLLGTLAAGPATTDHRVRFVWGAQGHFDVDAFERDFDWQVLRGGGYSSTDGGSVALPKLGQTVPEHCAGYVNATHEVSIVDADGVAVPTGAEGQIVLTERVPGVMFQGYLGMAAKTAEAIRDGRFYTGDVGWLGTDGQLFYLGRVNDRISRPGGSGFVHDITSVLDALPGVRCSAVLVDGDLMTAFVEADNVTTELADELLSAAQSELPVYLRPTSLRAVGTLPKTPTGKVALGELSGI